eukprot:TRINITY_DN27103_c0_g1_i3.p1 TRINITY_DN27103_c0_g1~~TRINITY_DN27103_c0_g1_i3.p1  ORF type:complete len:629 (+),score=108.43 TRINITY_DN27103_c0_g1_i3:146-1888(+)
MGLPWSTILLGRWHLPGLFAELGRTLSSLATLSNEVMPAESQIQNKCDAMDTEAEAVLRSSAGPDGMIPVDVAEQYLVRQGGTAATLQDRHRRCPFGSAAAVLSVAIEALKRGGSLPSGPLAGLLAEPLANAEAQMLVHTWEEVSLQYFFDFFTSHWRLPSLLQLLASLWNRRAGPQAAAEEEKARKASQSPPIVVPRAFLQQVLFLGGGETTFQWGSFTVRGRQAARGLRQIGVDARVWNSPCQAWCDHANEVWDHGDAWTPSAIIHIKFVCECAIKGWRHAAVHIYDPIDVFKVPEAPVDAILVQTSLALADLVGHPARAALKDPPEIFWLPLHHSNTHDVHIDAEKPVKCIGYHTVHDDEALREQLQELLRDRDEEFLHVNPSELFEYAEGRVSSPQQTDQVYSQMAALSVGVVKQSGCVSEWWFCSRWKTGQRLVNQLSVGIPAIVWGDAQGHLDVVEGRWQPSLRTSTHASPTSTGRSPRRYPAELVVSSRDELPRVVEALLNNVTLRKEASRRGRQIAEYFSPQRIGGLLVHILRKVALKRKSRRCRRERFLFALPRRSKRATRTRWKWLRYCR